MVRRCCCSHPSTPCSAPAGSAWRRCTRRENLARRWRPRQENPRQKLVAHGTTFVVPGQSLASRQIAASGLLPNVKIGPNANLVFFNLEEQGYVYSGTKGLDGE